MDMYRVPVHIHAQLAGAVGWPGYVTFVTYGKRSC